MSRRDEVEVKPRTIIGIIIGIVLLAIGIIAPFTMFTTVEAGEIVVLQAMDGKLTVWNTPGWKYIGFGSTTVYNKSDEWSFHAEKDGNGAITGTKLCKETRFNDQGKAAICGQLSFDLPSDSSQMLTIHEKYRSMDGIRARLIEPAMINSIYNSGPLMSSKESAGSRRGDLIEFIREQAVRGVYKTTRTVEEIDDLTSPPIEVVEMVESPKLDENGEPVINEETGKPVMIKKAIKVIKPRKKKVNVLEPKTDKNGKTLVQEASVTTLVGINLYNITIGNILYEDKVQIQINKQRDMEMQIQTKISEAEQAKQDAITAEQTGKAEAAKARWLQEKEKAKVVTQAQQAKEKAALDLETAKLEREAAVERAKGEAESKKLVMDADGALDKKLKAWQAVNKSYAEAFKSQPLVPEVIIGGGGKGGGDAANALVSLMAAQTARQIGLNTSIKK